MANYYDTLLVCKTDSKLLQKIDPRSLIKESNSEFITCKNGTYHFTTINGTMHESIVVLSEKFPKETFKAKIWNVDCYDSEIQTIKYKTGVARRTKVKPNYGYFISDIEKVMGKKLLRRFMKVALKQIKKIDSIDDAPTNKKGEKERERDIYSSITVSVQNRDFKIEATKEGRSFIQVNGYIKVKEGSYSRWQLIEREKNKIVKESHQLDESADVSKEEMYEPLPF